MQGCFEVISFFINVHSTLTVSFMVFTTVMINTVCLHAWAVNFLRTEIVGPLAYQELSGTQPNAWHRCAQKRSDNWIHVWVTYSQISQEIMDTTKIWNCLLLEIPCYFHFISIKCKYVSSYQPFRALKLELPISKWKPDNMGRRN